MAKSNEFYTTGEIASLCGVTHRTVVNWINRKHIKAHKLPGSRGDNRVTRDDLYDFMTRNQMPIPAELADSKPPIDTSSELILVVDDDVSMAKSIARILRQTTKEILIAHNGFEAGLIYAERNPSLMTLDLRMPKIDGFSMLKSLGEHDRKSGKILVVSASEDRDLERAKQLGADDTLSKPFESAVLLQKVTHLLQT